MWKKTQQSTVGDFTMVTAPHAMGVQKILARCLQPPMLEAQKNAPRRCLPGETPLALDCKEQPFSSRFPRAPTQRGPFHLLRHKNSVANPVTSKQNAPKRRLKLAFPKGLLEAWMRKCTKLASTGKAICTLVTSINAKYIPEKCKFVNRPVVLQQVLTCSTWCLSLPTAHGVAELMFMNTSQTPLPDNALERRAKLALVFKQHQVGQTHLGVRLT